MKEERLKESKDNEEMTLCHFHLAGLLVYIIFTVHSKNLICGFDVWTLHR